jgi:hypothetical protein
MRINSRKNSPVFLQLAIDLPDIIAVICIEQIVVTASAIIIAKFFVDSSFQFFAAMQTILFYQSHLADMEITNQAKLQNAALPEYV